MYVEMNFKMNTRVMGDLKMHSIVVSKIVCSVEGILAVGNHWSSRFRNAALEVELVS